MNAAEPRGHLVAVAVTDGAPVFELAVPCEVFGVVRRDLVDPWYELRLCADGPPPRTAAGFRLETPHGFAELPEADTVVVAACPREVQLAPPEPLVAAVREAYERGRRIVSICSGIHVLAAAGLLAGRRATMHWMYADDFARRYPEVRLDPTALYVEDGTLLTSAGTGAAIDTCLHLVRRDHGAAVANEVARRMVVPPHREGGQSQYAKPVRPPGRATRWPDGREPQGWERDLAPVLLWAQDRLDEQLSVPELARRAHMSERTFARRFRDALGLTPLQWLVRQRVRLAQELLETTDDPVESVARHTGFGTAANLRHHFGRLTTVSPQTYRRVFRLRAAAGRDGTEPGDNPGVRAA
ncbi:helix-turn-helix domain-containing protein [Streptomyces sp. B6B3]|uniref:GlxA family transcriptional regulator n=1 Tax=Streptomyces sp. B6B3 TaxID=3153570 RepID=UPI00325D5742